MVSAKMDLEGMAALPATAYVRQAQLVPHTFHSLRRRSGAR